MPVRQVAVGQSAYNFSPLKLGNYTLWVSSAGTLYIKNGTPASETDGTVVGHTNIRTKTMLKAAPNEDG
jgi:hypothetical protein